MAKHEIRPPLYKRWINIKTRCYNSKVPSYKYYGARGIKICDEWLVFHNFQRDMLPSFKIGLSLDRIDNNGDYSKENCRWATRQEQALNRRKRLTEFRKNNHFFEFNGIKQTLSDWARLLQIKKSTLSMRIYCYKWPLERALIKGGKYIG